MRKEPINSPNAVLNNLDNKIPKKETLEEAMILNGYHDKESDNLWREGVEFGAKWQTERSYSENEVINLILKRDKYLMTPNSKSLKEFLTPKEWFEQFKKK